jgi:hypothetical protein
MDYRDFQKKMDEYRSAFADAKPAFIEMFILDLIHTHSPNFMNHKAKEMIEECDFDHDTVVRSHFKRLLWKEVEEEVLREKEEVFKTDEEIIEELNKSVFVEKYPQFVPMPRNTEAEYEAQHHRNSPTSRLHQPCHPHPHDS